MTSRIYNLQTAQITLRKIRNRSTSLIPINTLPLELLIQIFRLSARLKDPFDAFMTGLVHPHHPKGLFDLSHVCTHWGAVVANTPSLWSDINFDVGFFKECNRFKLYNPITFCLERARDQLSSITFRSRDTMHISKHRLAMKSCLSTQMKNVKILRYIAIPEFHVLCDLFDLWQAEGQAGSVHSLSIFPDGNVSESSQWSGDVASDWPGNKRWDSFLLPVRVLRMVGRCFAWDSHVFHNLVVLQLGCVHALTSPTVQQILAVLSASPHLEHLQLFDMTITASDSTHPRPVVLNALEVLDVRKLEPEGVRLLLPMIIPRSREMSVSVGMHPDTSEVGSVTLAFLARSNITKLFLDPGPFSIADRSLDQYLSAAPNLHTLILDLGSGPGDTLLPAITQSISSASSSLAYAPRCPQLHTLYLMNGSIHYETIQKLVEVLPRMRKLGFVPCFLEPSDEEALYWLRLLVNDLIHTTTSLRREDIMNWFVSLV